jgi:redox-sensitive bicupin YhaK (pirin superfamily)
MDKHRDQRAIHINNKYAALQVAKLAAMEAVELPPAPFVHLFVARGGVDLEGVGALSTGDSARISASDGRRITAIGASAEVLIWEMHAALG